MKTPSLVLRRFWSSCVFILVATPALAGPASDTILPQTTKGYVSVAQPSEFQDRWRRTQLGQMLNDELMKPFVEDLREQAQNKYRAFEEKLGLKWDDLEGVPAGEMSVAVIPRKGNDAALAITIDVTNHQRQADALLAAVEKRFAKRGGSKETARGNGATLHVFTIPGDEGNPMQVTIYFAKENLLCGVDDRAEAEAMLKRFSGDAKDNLKSTSAYIAVMDRCRNEAKDREPEARWFVEPFGFVEAIRTLQKSHTRRTELDYVKILQEQGFDAIKGVGGFVNQLAEGHVELLHRTAIYAPPVDKADPLRWTKSMRMLQFPNVASFEPQSWVPRMSAHYTTANLRISDAFDNVGPLFDAVKQHEGAWVNSLKGWENDPFGPQVNVRKEFVENMGNRITVVTDYATPITTESERALIAIEATNEKDLSEALAKWMSREPHIVRRELGQVVVWERVPPDQALDEPTVEVPGFAPLEPESDEDAGGDDEDRESVLPSSAVTVALGQLMLASDIEYLQEILEGFGQHERLSSSPDYQQVLNKLNQLSPGDRCGFHFGRLDEEMRPTFELVRQGKMPESKTMLGKFLNNLLTTEEQRQEGELRKQRIDGSKLPSFEAVRRYFGPHGRITRAGEDGWVITGAVLNKEAP